MMSSKGYNQFMIKNVIFDVGRVLYQWDLRHLFAQLIDDIDELDWFLSNVVTPKWHFQHDAGRALADMAAELIAQYPDYESHIRAYTMRFNETIPGPVEGSLEIVEALAARDVPLYAITNFGAEFWDSFRPTAPIFDLFDDIIVSGREKMVKPDLAIYRLALERFDIVSEESLFIDDMPANIAAAEAIGIKGHLFDGAEGLNVKLLALNLL